MGFSLNQILEQAILGLETEEASLEDYLCQAWGVV
jgi:hypothetical protein